MSEIKYVVMNLQKWRGVKLARPFEHLPVTGLGCGFLYVFDSAEEALKEFPRASLMTIEITPAETAEAARGECGCGAVNCEGVNDALRHQCGGPREACAIPGCPECHAHAEER